MNRWAVVAEQNIAGYQGRWDIQVLAEAGGTREQALALLWHHVQSFRPLHPRIVERRRVYRDGDGFLVLNTGATAVAFPCRFRLVEQISDTGPV